MKATLKLKSAVDLSSIFGFVLRRTSWRKIKDGRSRSLWHGTCWSCLPINQNCKMGSFGRRYFLGNEKVNWRKKEFSVLDIFYQYILARWSSVVDSSNLFFSPRNYSMVNYGLYNISHSLPFKMGHPENAQKSQISPNVNFDW